MLGVSLPNPFLVARLAGVWGLGGGVHLRALHMGLLLLHPMAAHLK